ncbi:MAG TPA: hypothetical protein VGC28_01510 [Sphingomonas sp.]
MDLMDDLSSAVRSSCKLEGWQVALHRNVGRYTNVIGAVRVELSPTLSQASVTCVYQVLANWKTTLAAPAPVMVSPDTSGIYDGRQQPPTSPTPPHAP